MRSVLTWVGGLLSGNPPPLRRRVAWLGTGYLLLLLDIVLFLRSGVLSALAGLLVAVPVLYVMWTVISTVSTGRVTSIVGWLGVALFAAGLGFGIQTAWLDLVGHTTDAVITSAQVDRDRTGPSGVTYHVKQADGPAIDGELSGKYPARYTIGDSARVTYDSTGLIGPAFAADHDYLEIISIVLLALGIGPAAWCAYAWCGSWTPAAEQPGAGAHRPGP